MTLITALCAASATAAVAPSIQRPQQNRQRNASAASAFFAFALEPRILYDAAAATSARDPHNAADHAVADKVAASEPVVSYAMGPAANVTGGAAAAPALQ